MLTAVVVWLLPGAGAASEPDGSSSHDASLVRRAIVAHSTSA